MTAATTACPWTPDYHASTHAAKPVRLLELGIGPHGKMARCAFPQGWEGPIDLLTEADAWHPLFSSLPVEDTARLRRHLAHPVKRHPDGTRTRQGPLSFVTQEVNRLGNWTRARYFDVPLEDYSAGRYTGYRCAVEFLDSLKRGYGPPLDPICVIADACQARTAHFSKADDQPSRLGAADTFLEMVGHALSFMAKNTEYADHYAKSMTRALALMDWESRRRAEKAQGTL